jgi:hypothetical protein
VEKFATSISITNVMTFKKNTQGINEMFEKERHARKAYGDKIRNKEAVCDNYYEYTKNKNNS